VLRRHLRDEHALLPERVEVSGWDVRGPGPVLYERAEVPRRELRLIRRMLPR